ncbi:hypothetical protein [Crateriforma spongiae]|uniref:hypothetical protein n=1 Tax=Crateriforma spongiae TaxID=2724528 RepID=UPI001446248C|nr:hypothetical protein [Crateriforma spongiae]
MKFTNQRDRRTLAARDPGRWCCTLVMAMLCMVAGPNHASGQGGYPSPIDSPQTDLTPIGPPAYSGGTNGSGLLFDPYSTSGSAGASLGMPTTPPPVAGGSGYPNGGLFGQMFSSGPPATYPGGTLSSGSTTLPPPGGALPNAYGATTAAPYTGSIYNYPPTGGGSVYAPGPSGAGAYPSSIYPQGSPSTLFPNGMFGGASIGSVIAQDPMIYNAYRRFQGPRMRYTYIGRGSGAEDVNQNIFDFSAAFACQNFIASGRPLYIVPSFSLRLWDGPISPGGPVSPDLPGQAYDGFLDFGWQTDPNQMFGVELGIRTGVFTDFETMNSDSWRIRGKGLASFRLTPASTLKLGIYYLDRNTIQLLPAGGLLWQPNPLKRCDIFFPEPKFAHYWRTIGTQDVWWYIGGEYGGGAWTIERADGTSDNVEMNDLRAMFGFEWGQSELIRSGRRRAFIEFGYVWDREVNYKFNPQDDFSPRSAFMFRGGFGY